MVPARWLAPFRFSGRIHGPLLALFVAINSIAAFNAIAHDSEIGYDGIEHLAYVDALARGHLPSKEESLEFYSAPLPYALPAAFRLVGVTRVGVLHKIAQLSNVGAALVLTLFLIRICRLIHPADSRFALWTLLLLGMVPVFYKTLAFVRGEAWRAALGVVAFEWLLARGRNPANRDYAILGLLLGLALLAKQWAIFFVAAVIAYLLLRAWTRADAWRRMLTASLITAVMVAAVAGWFFVYLAARFGSPVVTAMANPPVALNRPVAFYTTLDITRLLTDPVRDHLSDDEQRLVPMLYAETWGDFWAYWLVAWDSERQVVISPAAYVSPTPVPDGPTLRPYLRSLAFAGLLPTLVFGGGLMMGAGAVRRRLRRRPGWPDGLVLCALGAWSTLAGFIGVTSWVAAIDPKATYIFQLFPLAAVLGAACLSGLAASAPRLCLVMKTGLVLVLIHNLPAMFSQYSVLGGIYRWR